MFAPIENIKNNSTTRKNNWYFHIFCYLVHPSTFPLKLFGRRVHLQTLHTYKFQQSGDSHPGYTQIHCLIDPTGEGEKNTGLIKQTIFKSTSRLDGISGLQ